MAGMSERRKLWADCYQIAGHLLLADDTLTKGQKQRLIELLLNVLSEPERYKAKIVRSLYRMALSRQDLPLRVRSLLESKLKTLPVR